MKRSLPSTDYWIFRLNLPALLLILRRSRGAPIGRLTYIHSTWVASLFIALFSRFKLLRFSSQKIQPRSGPAGPVFHLSEVRDDKGRVITLDAYHSVLKIRSLILNDLLNRFEILPFVSKKSSEDMLEAWLGMKIAAEITPIVYLSYYSRWEYLARGAEEKRKNILVLPHLSWIDLLAASLQKEQLTDEILVVNNWKPNLKILILVSSHLIRSLITILSCRIIRAGSNRNSEREKKFRILIPYSLGIETSKRNDIPFVHAVDFDPSSLLFVFNSLNALPDPAEFLWLKEKGISCFLGPDISKTSLDIPFWRPSRERKTEMALFCRAYLKFVLKRFKDRRKYSLWLLFHFWELGEKISFWKDFFNSNKVRAAVYSLPSAPQFLINLALSEVGGISIEMERSILFDYCTYIHNCPCHVKFVTGPYSLTQIPEPSYSQLTLQSGSIHVLENSASMSEIQTRKRRGQIGLAVFDELPNDWFFGDSIRQLYEAVAGLVREDNLFFLLIKTKKIHVLERLIDVKADLMKLQQEEKCVLLDWKTSVSAAALSSDLAVSVPSTAAFESVLSKKPTLVYNPMRAGIRLFYKNGGLNRRVFEDQKSLTAALKRFADGDSSIGDCSDLVSEIDAFDDGRGAKRIGGFVMRCLEKIDEGQSQEEVLKRVNAWYSKTWGEAENL